MSTSRIWFITGASQGLGLALTQQLLAAGHRVAATSRRLASLTQALGAASDFFLPLETDLTSDESVRQALAATVAAFGPPAVVVNNAGYGIGGSIEELTDAETRAAFDVNVFGALNVVRHALPYLRAARAGHVINVSSIAGFTAATGWAIYAATKFAMEGFSEVLAQDVAAFGLKVTLIEPGAFRTNFLTADSLVMPARPLAEYAEVRASHARYLALNGAQAGDPAKAAAAIIRIAAAPTPPLRLLLGADAHQRALHKLDTLRQEFEQWQGLTLSTGFGE